MKRALVFTMIITLPVAFAGCGGDAGDGNGPEDKPASGGNGATTPAALLDKMEAFLKSDDPSMLGLVDFVLPDEQPALAGMMSVMPAMMAGMAAAFAPPEKKEEMQALAKEAEGLLEKYGLADKMKAMGPGKDLNGAQKLEKLNELMKGVDHRALMRDASALMDKMGDGKTEKKMDAADLTKARASLKIDGDRATMPDPRGGKQPMTLVKAADGCWYVSAVASGLFDQ